MTFRHQHENSEDLEPNDEAGGYVPVTTVKLYPGRVVGRRELENAYLLPWEIRRVYDETRQALGSGLQVLAGIGIRALVEAVCTERQATGSNLEAGANRFAGSTRDSDSFRCRDSSQPPTDGKHRSARG